MAEGTSGRIASDWRLGLSPTADSKALNRLLLARWVSLLGDGITPVALAFAVLDISGTGALGAVLAARTVTGVAFLPIGGVIGDRIDRRRVLLASELTAMASQASLGVLIVTRHADIPVICALIAVRGACGAIFNPTATSAVRHIAGGNRQRAFALLGLGNNVADIAGPALAGAWLVIAGPGWLLIGDAASFAISVLLVRTTRDLGRAQRDKAFSMITDLREGLEVIARLRWLMAITLTSCAFQFCWLSCVSVLGPAIAKADLGGARAWALISLGLGLGGVLGSSVAARVRPRHPLFTGFVMLVLGTPPTLFLLAIPAPTVALVFAQFLAGSIIGFFTVLESMAVASHTPPELLSRVDSLNRMGSAALSPLGLLVVGIVPSAIGDRSTLLIFALLTLVAVGTPLFSRSVRHLADAPVEASDAENFATLCGLGISTAQVARRELTWKRSPKPRSPITVSLDMWSFAGW